MDRQAFLDLALRLEVLRFGEFTLKSGRLSPYFFNAGLISSGAALSALGRAYARALADSGVGFAHPAADPREDIAQLAHRGAVPAIDEALHRLHRPGTGAHVHREEMVDRVQLQANH